MSDELALRPSFSNVQLALRGFAAALARIKDAEVPQAIEYAKMFERLGEELYNGLKERALLYLNVNGEQVGDKGSTTAEVGGYTITAIPTRTGFDPKKVEAMLRRQSMDPSAGMDSTITWKVNEKKLLGLGLPQSMLESCRYEKSYRIEVKNEGR